MISPVPSEASLVNFDLGKLATPEIRNSEMEFSQRQSMFFTVDDFFYQFGREGGQT